MAQLEFGLDSDYSLIDFHNRFWKWWHFNFGKQFICSIRESTINEFSIIS